MQDVQLWDMDGGGFIKTVLPNLSLIPSNGGAPCFADSPQERFFFNSPFLNVSSKIIDYDGNVLHEYVVGTDEWGNYDDSGDEERPWYPQIDGTVAYSTSWSSIIEESADFRTINAGYNAYKLNDNGDSTQNYAGADTTTTWRLFPVGHEFEGENWFIVARSGYSKSFSFTHGLEYVAGVRTEIVDAAIANDIRYHQVMKHDGSVAYSSESYPVAYTGFGIDYPVLQFLIDHGLSLKLFLPPVVNPNKLKLIKRVYGADPGDYEIITSDINGPGRVNRVGSDPAHLIFTDYWKTKIIRISNSEERATIRSTIPLPSGSRHPGGYVDGGYFYFDHKDPVSGNVKISRIDLETTAEEDLIEIAA